MIKIVIVEPNKQPYVKQTKNELSVLQSIVGGYIEAVYLNNDIFLMCNGEGKIADLPYNRTINGNQIVGNFFLTTNNRKGDFISLTDKQVKICMDMFLL